MGYTLSKLRFAGLPLITAMLVVPAGFAQYDRPYGDSDTARRDRAVFDRARVDLYRASSYAYASRSDRKRFDEARRELFDFQSRFDRGHYERHELDQAIDRL